MRRSRGGASPPIIVIVVLCLGICLLDSNIAFAATGETKTLPWAVAQEDDQNARPLRDALDLGFSGVEASLCHWKGKLIVHRGDRSPTAERTLQDVYLSPLLDRVQRNKGAVYPGGGEFYLILSTSTLLDFVDENIREAEFRALRDALKPYAEMLTEFGDNHTTTRAVTVIYPEVGHIGKRMTEPPRLMAPIIYPEDLADPEMIATGALVVVPWQACFRWRGDDWMPEPEWKRLGKIVSDAHRARLKLLIADPPGGKRAWTALMDAGVDLFTAKDLDGCAEYLIKRPPWRARD